MYIMKTLLKFKTKYLNEAKSIYNNNEITVYFWKLRILNNKFMEIR